MRFLIGCFHADHASPGLVEKGFYLVVSSGTHTTGKRHMVPGRLLD